MTQLTQEEIRDEVLSIFEEHEDALLSLASKIEKIESESMITFEKKVIAIKNRLIDDVSVPDDKLEEVCLQEIELARKVILDEAKKQIEELVKSQERH